MKGRGEEGENGGEKRRDGREGCGQKGEGKGAAPIWTRKYGKLPTASL